MRHAAHGLPDKEAAELGLDQSSWIIKDVPRFRAAVKQSLSIARKRPQQLAKSQNFLAEKVATALRPPRLPELFEKRLAFTFGVRAATWTMTRNALLSVSSHEAVCFTKTIVDL